MTTPARKIRCPQCGNETLYHPDNAHRPFCSARCRLIDLGQWAEEKYRVPAEPVDPSGHNTDIQ